MGINTNTTTGNIVNIHYSNFLGGMFVANDANNAAMKEVKAEIGEDAVKKGFVGAGSNCPSGKARELLQQKGVDLVSLSGILTGVRVREKEKDGRKTCYLNVGFKDDDGRYYLSVDLNNQGSQMLARKLVNAVPGKLTDLSMFATYAKKEGAAQAYAEHGVSLKQGNDQVPGVSPKDELAPRVEAALKALKDVGVDDKETLRKRRQGIQLDYHKNLMTQVEAKFASYYEEIGVSSPAQNNAEVGTGEEDLDEIPF